jgi:predicted small metal-binding protein
VKTYDVPRGVRARQVRCAEVMPGCGAVVDGRDSAEVMARMMTHLIEDHGIATPPFELVTRAHAAIRDT